MIANLFEAAAGEPGSERFDDLLARPGIRIERILSAGGASPADHWYDQAWDEWVLLIEGSAGLEIEGDPVRTLARGDHLLIPARTRHRVAWTAAGCTTIWLAVHIGEPA
ncbi:MAG: cupin [Sphingomonas bacterium]|jgi:cupin 2 domain-containing protein|nr:cupin [Sphingomonas bacterium]